MKNQTIEQIKSIHTWTPINFHGNRKKVGQLSIDKFTEIVKKKRAREYAKIDLSKKTNVQITRRLINQALKTKGTNYFKIMIEGSTGIYLASPVYLHSDYNKCRLFDKNDETLKLMDLFNKIVNK